MSQSPNQYLDFVAQKADIAQSSDDGFDVPLESIHPSLRAPQFRHQAATVRWALRRSRALLALTFGLGKTTIQTEIARHVHARTGGIFLIVAPLAVRHQFIQEDGPRLGITWEYVFDDESTAAAALRTPYLITNYERVRDGKIDPSKHNITGISLDEGSTLRSMGSKTYQTFQRIFAHIPYRYVATATPSPNEYKEIIYYAQFLGWMDTGQALTRWFKRDASKAGHLTLYPSQEKSFWLWVASWALFLYSPADIGFSDAGYDLPPLTVNWHRVTVDHRRAWDNVDSYGQARLLLDAANSVSEAATEKRQTMASRIAKMLEIIATDPAAHWIIWHDLEDERKAIEKALPSVVSVYGNQSVEEKEQGIMDFSHGKIQYFATKPIIAGSGCNFQKFCHKAIYLGVGYKFQDFIQSVHRLQRFQQPHDVDIHIIYAESEESVVQVLQRKWSQHDTLSKKMRAIIQKYGLSRSTLEEELKRSVGVERLTHVGNYFTSARNDCVLEMPNIATDSVQLIHTSIPFGNHYEYTTQMEDFGHNSSDEEFWGQMDFLIPELLRVTEPGRIAAIHVKDRILYGHQTKSGFMEVSPFSDECVMAFKKHGWMYEGRRTIMTDVVRENNGTYRLGWTELTNDSSKMGSGLPEYLLLFRKPPSNSDNARADNPITKDKTTYTRGRWQIDASALWKSNGNRHLHPSEFAAMLDLSMVARLYTEEQLTEPYDHERHVAICEEIDNAGHLPSTYMLLPPKVTTSDEDWVWDDIVYMRTLNSQQSMGRRENHICPLPLDIVERTIRLYSNEGDTVLDPFAGLHTVPVKAIEMGRSAIGIELNPDYWHWGIQYCESAEINRSAPSLFDLGMFSHELELEKVPA